ncbi:MAG TPA: cytochrome C oxidase subunit IV family protein [Gemmatimonadales bacterium]|jgi:cytochrome c oxidase subunit 4|nr:cytochrome C oxidase subunit IV family protein [Gemmatimonadales bacterium]
MTEHTQAQAHAHGGHPTAGVYVAVAAVLTVLTVTEVGVFYIPAFHPILAPALILLSASKFALVVLFYMHLKMDNRLFSALFSLPLLIAFSVLVALMFLFGVFTL